MAAKLYDKRGWWRDLAQEMRTDAAKMHDPEAKRIANDIASQYDRLAGMADECAANEAAGRKKEPPPPAGTAFSIEVDDAVHRGR